MSRHDGPRPTHRPKPDASWPRSIGGCRRPASGRLRATYYRMGRDLARGGLPAPTTRRDPGRDPRRLDRRPSSAKSPGSRPARNSMDQPIDNLDVVREVIAAFDTLGIAYALGGSWASSFHGDHAVHPRRRHLRRAVPGPEAALVAQLRAGLLREPGRDPPGRPRPADVQHHQHVCRVQGRRLRPQGCAVRSVADGPADPVDRWATPGSPWSMISPEDTILLKLEWYRLGGEISERQWLGRPRRPAGPGRPARRGVPRPLGGRAGRRRPARRRPARCGS